MEAFLQKLKSIFLFILKLFGKLLHKYVCDKDKDERKEDEHDRNKT